LVHDPYREFRQAVDRVEEKIDLGRAALALAVFDYPQLDIAAYLGRIDELAVDVAKRSDCGATVGQPLDALNYVLFQRHGFRGNGDDYYNPKNSFLNEVLERRTGIPITLSVLYMEVAQRIGLPLDGVGFPGHFLVKHARGGAEMFIDPFHQGAVRSREDLRAMLASQYGGAVELQNDFLNPAGKKEILKRMLANLKGIYANANDMARLLSVLDLVLILEPGAVEQIRERAGVYLRLECFSQARADFEAYLRLAPDAQDAAAVREQVVSLAKRVTLLH
jgi:regulator of sirC expression with transglutaminase-like and TPR domain